ncbi:G-type lectin S-receptor-like serine/threonine-protein kinase At4g27290 isoform X2 [Sesamum indicum]|uniref:Receptor-like serine/threonine-protein kinase n=1 Tax=Sesamum indicum TaxID=4182 RepID=A0A6I9UDE5_SESIN|nr:G-type lectin S-receptor-like serine/threonine-protein kinase At4g27290 isoform X2 [Sesamum indicum]
MAYWHFTTFLCTILHAVTLLKFSIGADTLRPNQTIVNGQTLISQSQIFEVGFFSPGASANSFLGIWYRNTPDVVCWVANRNNPITDPEGVFLAIARNGALVISGAGRVIWSANSSGRVASNPILQLLDTGNLVVVDEAGESSSPKSYIWQSFDYPSDTRLPGMDMVDNTDTGQEKYLTSWRNSDDPSPGNFSYRIENQGLAEMVIFQGTTKIYRTGQWNGLGFMGTPPYQSPAFKSNFEFKNDVLVSMSEIYNYSMVARLRIEPSGILQRYSMNEKKDKWNLVFTLPQDLCDNYGRCGPYGICNTDKTPICECLKGFAPKAQQEWDWSSGCARIRPLDCGDGDGFVGLSGVKFPDMLKFWLNTSMTIDECRAECLKNCNCTAYANPYRTGGRSGCLIWFGDLIDIREVPGADNKQILYIRLPVSELESTNLEKTQRKKKMPGKVRLTLAAAGVVFFCLICCTTLVIRRLKRQAERKNEDLELPLFRLSMIAAATNNFSNGNMIGEGGFGLVYKGNLSAEEEIAVKRLSKTSTQGLEEFKNEVILIVKLQHRNLVRLLGCCIEGEERLLIYEYMQNGSLDYFVFDETRRKLLTWPKRFDIIMGIARGLLYLHHDSRLRIIHRDLKTSNILLDANLNPKISDFGLARTSGCDQSVDRTKRVVGTYGYMAPEYAIDGKFSVKSDVFSMGVLLLEIVSGKRNRGFTYCGHHHSLLGHAWLLWQENKDLELIDECLNDTFVESQVKRCIQVGLLCVQRFPEDRPVMSSVLFMLGSEGVVLPQPKEPGFFMEGSCSNSAENHIRSTESNKGSITITELEPR